MAMMRKLVLCALGLLLAACATMRAVPPPVQTMDFLNGRDFIVAEPYRYSVGQSGQTIEIPAGFVTDFASIPSPLWGILGPHGRYSRAVAVHDFLYWSQSCTREQADNLLMIQMKELGVSRGQRWVIYHGVRIGGQFAWDANGRELAAGRPKIVPRNRFGLATANTWREARQILFLAGVRDPAVPKGASYCTLGNSRDVPGPAGSRPI
jgi:hypothetical protein